MAIFHIDMCIIIIFFHPFRSEYFNKYFHWMGRLKNGEAVQKGGGLWFDKLEVVDC